MGLNLIKYPGQLLFGKKPDYMKAGMPYLNQIPDVGKQYYNPFIEQGAQAGEALGGQYGQMAQNPMDYLSSILGGYSESPQFKFQRDQALRGAQNSAAAGGFSGNQYDQQKQGQMANDLAGQDIYKYLESILGIQGQGMAGQERQVGRGFEASGQLSDLLAGNLGSQAGLAVENSKARHQFGLQKRMALLNGAAQAFGGGAGGGFMGTPGGGPSPNTINWR